MTTIIKGQLNSLKESNTIDSHTYRKGNALYINGACQVLSQGNRSWEILVDGPGEEVITKLAVQGEELNYEMNGKKTPWSTH